MEGKDSDHELHWAVDADHQLCYLPYAVSPLPLPATTSHLLLSVQTFATSAVFTLSQPPRFLLLESGESN